MPNKITGNYTKNPPIYPPHQPETAADIPGVVPKTPPEANTNKQPSKPVGTGTASFANPHSGAFDTEYFGDTSSPGRVTSPARMMASYHSGATNIDPPKDTWNWEKIKGRIKQAWANLTDEEVDYYAINRDRFFTAVHNRYGINKEEASHRMADWEKNNPNYAA